MMNDLTIQRCIREGISSETLRSIELETGLDVLTIIQCLVAAKNHGWQPPKTHAGIQFENRRSHMHPFPPVLEGDR